MDESLAAKNKTFDILEWWTGYRCSGVEITHITEMFMIISNNECPKISAYSIEKLHSPPTPRRNTAAPCKFSILSYLDGYMVEALRTLE